MGAFVGIVFNLTFAETLGPWTPWLSMLVAMVVSGLFAIIHAIATVSLRADHVVSGIAINFLALGLGVFLTKQWYEKGQTDMISKPFYTKTIPLLSDIPVIGTIFFKGVYLTSYIAIILAFVAWYVLYKTHFGLRFIAVGYHPLEAVTKDIHVYLLHYYSIIH